ncbi:MAG: F0F1 ATP synthase subunit delta [Cellvibrionales bacterium]|nr:MAG: F0F1 ATP synthase subunit delta [Cellvibrionales bacterium]
MAELSTLARPYAKAAFEFADQADGLEQWSAMLNLLAALAQEDSVAKLFNSPSETPVGKAQKLIDICADELSPQGQNFIHIVAENRRLSLLPEISTQFEALKAEREMTVEVEVVSAREMSADQQAGLASALKERLQRTVSINVSIDPTLLGGAIIRAGDTIIDGSVRGRLAKLAEAINS